MDDSDKYVELRNIRDYLRAQRFIDYLNTPDLLFQKLNEEKHKAVEAIENQSAVFAEQISMLANGQFKMFNKLVKDIKISFNNFEKSGEGLDYMVITENSRKLKTLIGEAHDYEDVSKVTFFDLINDDSYHAIVSDEKTLMTLLKQSNNTVIKEITDISQEQKNELTVKQPDPILTTLQDFQFRPQSKAISTRSFCNNNNSSGSYGFYKVPKRSIYRGYIISAEIQSFSGIDEFYVQNLAPVLVSEDKEFHEGLQKFYNRETFKAEVLRKPNQGFIAAYNQNGTWYRVRIVDIWPYEKTCKVFLLDAGQYDIAQMSELVKLHPKFFERHQISIRCCMADIAPLFKYGKKYPDKAIDEIKLYTENPDFKIEIHFTKEMETDSEDAAPCIVYAYKWRDEQNKINLNALLVAHHLAQSTRKASETLAIETEIEREFEVMKDEESKRNEVEDKIQEQISQQPTTRVSIRIEHVVNPGEFYVSVPCRNEEFKKIREELNIIELLELSKKETWQVNEMCLAYHSVQGQEMLQFSRAIIREQVDYYHYKIFLIDYPREAEILSSNLFIIPNEYATINPRVFKVHLAEAFPPGRTKNWPISSIELFQSLLDSYKLFAISVVGDVVSETESVPVVLYGVEEKRNNYNYHNLILYMYDKGLLDTTAKISNDKLQYRELKVMPCNLKPTNQNAEATTLQFYSKIMSGIEKKNILKNRQELAMEHKIELDVDYTSMNVTPKIIKSWKPAEKFAVGKRFMGNPSHVDKNGIIYIQPRESLPLLAEMNRKITSFYEDFDFVQKFRNVKTSFNVGDCVIVRYLLDMKFYRGVVVGKQMNNYNVEYIDYGTRKTVKSTDMYAMVIGENIPILVSRYVLTDILPMEGREWTVEEINFFQSRLCDNLCNVDVTTECPGNDDIQGVSIKVLEEDKQIDNVAEQAICEGFGRFNSGEAWPIEFTDEITIAQPNEVSDIEYNDVSLAVMKQYITKRNISDASGEENANNNVEKQNQISIAAITKMSNRTNIVKKKMIKKTKYFDLLTIECEQFKCELIRVCDPQNLIFFVEPKLKEIQVPFNELMDQYAKATSKNFNKFNSLSSAVKKSCIVKFPDSCHRGEILEIDDDKECAKVYFVDTGETSTVSIQNLRKMEMNAIKCPRKILKVKLNVKKLQNDPNRRREYAESLVDIYKGDELDAIIKGYDQYQHPIVDLKFQHYNIIDIE